MKKLIVLLVVAAVVVTSCTTFKASNLTYTRKVPKATELGDFRTEVWIHGFLGGSAGIKLFNITADGTEKPLLDAIQDEIRNLNGDAAIDVTIEHQASFIDLLLNGITASIYAPSLVIVSGTVVKYD